MIPLDAGCTGSSARWCPVCGDCACGPRYEGAGADGERTLDDDGCPLHGASSQHAREPARAVIPLDRVRELLSLAPGPHGGTLMDTSMVHDLARDVLSLADALATAERERDEAREIAVALGEVTERQGRMLARAPTFEDAMALCIEAIVSTAADAPNCAEWRGTMGGREFVLSLQWADGKSPHALLSEARAERDTARSALDGLRAAVRAERECETARSAAAVPVAPPDLFDALMVFVAGAPQSPALAASQAACEAHASAKAATDALLRGAPGGYVEARVVREYLTKLDALPGPLASIDAGALLSAYEQERVTRTALDVAIAAAEGR